MLFSACAYVMKSLCRQPSDKDIFFFQVESKYLNVVFIALYIWGGGLRRILDKPHPASKLDTQQRQINLELQVQFLLWLDSDWFCVSARVCAHVYVSDGITAKQERDDPMEDEKTILRRMRRLTDYYDVHKEIGRWVIRSQTHSDTHHFPLTIAHTGLEPQRADLICTRWWQVWLCESSNTM